MTDKQLSRRQFLRLASTTVAPAVVVVASGPSMWTRVLNWFTAKRPASVVVSPEEIVIPTGVLTKHRLIDNPEFRLPRYYIVDRAQVRAKNSLQRMEDAEVFKVINAGIPSNHLITVSDGNQTSNINRALALIQPHELVGAFA